MAKQSKDFLTQVREQAERTLAILTAEIRKREAELENLLEQARLWRDALTSSFAPALGTPKPGPKKKAAKKKAAPKKAAAKRKTASKKAPAKKKAAKKKAAAGGRVDWDAILASVPATFTIDDVMKQPGARSKGRNQVYPAINRWVKAKKARKVGPGRYKRLG